jgi:hypothetical protein
LQWELRYLRVFVDRFHSVGSLATASSHYVTSLSLIVSNVTSHTTTTTTTTTTVAVAVAAVSEDPLAL